MIKKITILILTLCLYDLASGQSLSEFLDKVSANNPEILAHRKLLEARRIEARTGLAPSDPFISAGFMPGNTEEAGNKKTWSVSQSFDFPTKYLLQKKINNNTILLAEQEFNLGRLMVMLEAELTVFDLIYNRKALNVLIDRKEGYDRLRSAWQKMLETGETTIMDYNKILLELSAITLEITKKKTTVDMLNEKIRYMSGSDENVSVMEEYPIITVPDFDHLILDKSEVHPAFLIPEIEYLIKNQEVRLTRTGSLPGFQIGYQSEILPEATYTGPVAGLTIPLWANSNRIRSAIAAADHSAALRDALIMKLRSQSRNDYSNMLALQKSIAEVRNILESGGGTRYPDIALSAGEITLTTWFMYIEVLYESEDRLLELENEYQKALATLLDHNLIDSPLIISD
jgi:outer membrane protein TolC